MKKLQHGRTNCSANNSLVCVLFLFPVVEASTRHNILRNHLEHRGSCHNSWLA
ncbi:hypothetical protein BS78_K105900 [Paspalum vaginatum]|uniref:Uncharacterized protein n=1 Tax=Paspalum vaginatum TaxID=158149 RepID=A0A9W7XCD4_9POAL|nr:hypothetical protein BS78_K105900 [Paspalum vaginatum]